MANKTCGECKNFQKDCVWVTAATDAWGCIDFEKRGFTNGDKIRQMTNPKLVRLFYSICFNKATGHYAFYSTLLDKWYEDEPSCFDAVLAYLNAPAESEDEKG